MRQLAWIGTVYALRVHELQIAEMLGNRRLLAHGYSRTRRKEEILSTKIIDPNSDKSALGVHLVQRIYCGITRAFLLNTLEDPRWVVLIDFRHSVASVSEDVHRKLLLLVGSVYDLVPCIDYWL